MSAPIEVFYSYSHKDEDLRDKLEKHLAILKRTGVITDWYDRAITAGEEWRGEIDEHLESAGVILLLISADFLASDYCYDVEMNRALERHEAGEARVIPVMLRPVDSTGAPFGKLQALPKGARAVILWDNIDEAFADVAKGIRAAVGELLASASSFRDRTLLTSRPIADGETFVDAGGGPGTVPPFQRRGSVASVEFTLAGPPESFDETAFMAAASQILGQDVLKVRIADIRAGSTIVRMEGDGDALTRLVNTLKSSQAQMHDFMRKTGVVSMSWEIGGQRYHLKRSRPPATPNNSIDDQDRQRLREVEERLELLYRKLHEFQKRKIASADVAERFSIEQRIRDEIVTDLRTHERDHAQLLARMTKGASLPSSEAEALVAELSQAIKATEIQANEKTPSEVVGLLREIKATLEDPGKSATAKLQVSLPIIPTICTYQLEVDTENFLTAVWQKVKAFFGKAIPHPPR